jgi:hypothetical protein
MIGCTLLSEILSGCADQPCDESRREDRALFEGCSTTGGVPSRATGGSTTKAQTGPSQGAMKARKPPNSQSALDRSGGRRQNYFTMKVEWAAAPFGTQRTKLAHRSAAPAFPLEVNGSREQWSVRP